ncbi:hypothetical protein F7734_41940 [Scytonema sp. UIC 10036]|nr:hypothetical protein [Scytonema sp. UIC 10036]
MQVTDEQLRLMASLPYQLVSFVNSLQYIIYKCALKLCPYCLTESAYCRKIWDWDLVKACYLHQCVLINKCPGCQKIFGGQDPQLQGVDVVFIFVYTIHKQLPLTKLILSVYLSSLEKSLATAPWRRH